MFAADHDIDDVTILQQESRPSTPPAAVSLYRLHVPSGQGGNADGDTDAVGVAVGDRDTVAVSDFVLVAVAVTDAVMEPLGVTEGESVADGVTEMVGDWEGPGPNAYSVPLLDPTYSVPSLSIAADEPIPPSLEKLHNNMPVTPSNARSTPSPEPTYTTPSFPIVGDAETAPEVE